QLLQPGDRRERRPARRRGRCRPHGGHRGPRHPHGAAPGRHHEVRPVRGQLTDRVGLLVTHAVPHDHTPPDQARNVRGVTPPPLCHRSPRDTYCAETLSAPVEDDPPVTYVIAEPCVDLLDNACLEECPVDCIYEGARMLYIHPDECVDCGACEPVCPVEAIYYEDDVPETLRPYIDENVKFFTDTLPGQTDPLGSPGGAAKLGVVDADTPMVAALAPQGD